jgi:hypothetical protein
LVKQSPTWEPQTESPKRKLKLTELQDFLKKQFRERKAIVSPWLMEQSVNMVYANRGVGKTFFGLALANHIVRAKSFLGWDIPKAEGVLYLDGEMPASLLQERNKELTKDMEENMAPLFIFNPEDVGKRLDLSRQEDRELLKDTLVDLKDIVKIIIIDNISCLIPVKENEADEWVPINNFLIELRHLGFSVILVHHTNKNGGQRGTSKREDPLDVTIELKHADDYSSDKGAKFILNFTKGRHLYGPDAAPLEVKLESKDGALVWNYGKARESATTIVKNILQALGGKCTRAELVKEIQETLGIGRTQAFERVKQTIGKGIEEQGKYLVPMPD